MITVAIVQRQCTKLPMVASLVEVISALDCNEVIYRVALPTTL